MVSTETISPMRQKKALKKKKRRKRGNNKAIKSITTKRFLRVEDNNSVTSVLESNHNFQNSSDKWTNQA